MSKCLTIADEAVDQKDTCAELTSKNIVEVILEEALVSAVIISDKSCSQIGDFNIAEDFCQQFDQSPEYSKDLDLQKPNPIQNSSAHFNQELNLNSGESNNHSVSLLTAKENLELILDSLVKREEKIKTECKVISEETLADCELRIENGQIYIDRNRRTEKESKVLCDSVKNKEVGKNEQVEGVHLNDRNSNKIIGRIESRPNKVSEVSQSTQEKPESEKNVEEIPGNGNKIENKMEDDSERKDGSETIKTDELGQVWECEKSPVAGDWDGDVSAKPKETAQIEEKQSSSQVYSENNDPHRPRAWGLAEEDLIKMVKEIEEINFNHSISNHSDEFDMGYHPDGQGDADLDPYSCVTNGSHDEERFSNMQSLDSFDVRSIKDKTGQEKTAVEAEETDSGRVPTVFSENTKTVDQPNIESLTFQDVRGEMGQQKMTAELKETNDNLAQITIMSEGTEIVSQSNIKSVTSQEVKDKQEQKNAELETCGSQMSSVIFADAVSHLDVESPTLQNVKDETEEQKVDEEIKEVDNSQTPTILKPEGTEIVNQTSINSMKSKDEKDEKSQGGVEEVDNMQRFILPQEMEEVNRLTSSTSCAKLKTSENGSTNSTGSKVSLMDSENLAQPQSLQSDQEAPNASPDMQLCTEKPSDKIRWSRSETDTPQDHFSVLIEQGSSSTGRLDHKKNKWESKDSNSDSLAERKISFMESKKLCDSRNGSENFLQAFNLSSDPSKNHLDASDVEEALGNLSPEPDTDAGNVGGEKESVSTSQYESLENLKNSEAKRKSSGGTLSVTETEDDEQVLQEVKDSDLSEQSSRQRQSTGALDTRAPSESQSSLISESKISANIDEVQSDSWTWLPQSMKLQSQKMYPGVDHDTDGRKRENLALTDPDDAYIEETENVIQIIEPAENSNDEDSDRNITFSLLSECNQNQESSPPSLPSSSEHEARGSETEVSRKVISGMTSIGPIKYIDYDPKDLTASEIDFGKMTRITSSRQLTKDIFGMEIKTIPSVKIVEEDDSEDDNDSLERNQSDRRELGPLVNRDIASLTKVQKVREVMFHHPKADEDLDDDENVTRAFLDLKDVESMTDERHKMADINLQLVSIDVEDINSDLDKEFIETMDTVLRGTCLNSSYCNEDETEETKEKSNSISGSCDFADSVPPNESIERKTKTTGGSDAGEVRHDFTRDRKLKVSSDFVINNEDEIKGVSSNSQRDPDFTRLKCNTMSSLFKKASKINRKDGDLYLKNTKSLPRNTSALTSSDSIKSMLNDCQSSVHNVLKKSRSLLRNTQSIFRAFSQTRFSSHESPTPFESSSPSETQINHMDKRANFFKKEDFCRAKNLFKFKMEKGFGSRDGGSSPRSESEAIDDKDARTGVKSRESSPADRLEVSKKLLAKSPLVYKSQFVKSQLSVSSNNLECPSASAIHEAGSKVIEPLGMSASEESKDKDLQHQHELNNSDKEIELSFDEATNEVKLSWACDEYSYQITEEIKQQQEQNQRGELEQPDYIVMETIEGLPDVDIAFASQEIGSVQLKETEESEGAIAFQSPASTGDFSNKLKAQNSTTSDNLSFQSVADDKETSTSLPNKKNKTFSARFRSFWYSAFKRIKMLPKDVEPS